MNAVIQRATAELVACGRGNGGNREQLQNILRSINARGDSGSLMPGPTVSLEPGVKDDHIRTGLGNGSCQDLQSVGREPVVAVQELKIVSGCGGESFISGRRDSLVFLMDDMDPGIGGGIIVTDCF